MDRGVHAYLLLPLPLSCTVCGLLFALSVITSVPNSSAAAFGVNVTAIEQTAPATRVGGQSLTSVNTVGAPETSSISTGNPGCFLLPLGLDTFTVFGLLDAPTAVS